MNLLCPNCQKMLSVSEQYAGQLMKCPHCANAFTAPSLPRNPVLSGAESLRQGAAASETVIPLSAAPESPPHSEGAGSNSTGDGSLPPARPQTAPLAGYGRTRTIWISPRVVPWIPPAALVLVFFLTFFPWVRTRIPPVPELTYNAWQLGFGQGNALMVIFLVLFLLTLVVMILDIAAPRLMLDLPEFVHRVMPWRSAIVAGAVALSFVFLFLQTIKAFNVEELVEPAGVALRSAWLRLAVTLYLVALIAAALDVWLFVRKSRPLPRIDISW